MKKLIIALALVAGFAAGALAQVPIYAPQTIGLPSVIAVANSPTNFPTPFLIDCSKQGTVAFHFEVQSADASSTTNVTFKAAPTVDGVKYDTNNSITLTANMLAGVPCNTDTNTRTLNGLKGYYIWQENIGANSQITNRSASYGQKISAP